MTGDTDHNTTTPPVWQLDAEELVARLQDTETRIRELQAQSLAVIAEAERRDLHQTVGYPSLRELLRHALRITRREAQHRIDLAAQTTPSTSITGTVIEPPLPALAAAASEGVIGREHIDVIHTVLRALPPHIPDEDRTCAEQILVDAALFAGPDRADQSGTRDHHPTRPRRTDAQRP